MRILRSGVCALAVFSMVAGVSADNRRPPVIHFTQAPQLYCNRGCSVVGAGGCDQPDADLFCKLKTGSPLSVATSFSLGMVQDAAGFTCPGIGTQAPNLGGRGIGVAMYYSDESLLSSHGDGQSITNVVCTNP